MDIGLAASLFGGVLSLLSPCSVMLLPAFFSFAFSSPGKLMANTGIFYLGLISTLVPMGVLAGSFGSLLSNNRTLLIQIAAVVVIIFGLLQLLGVPMPGMRAGAETAGTSPVAVYILGTVYGLAGACTGPILGSVLAIAAVGENALYGGIMLAVFALGMVVPLLLLSFIWSRFRKVQAWLRPKSVKIGRWQNTWTGIIGGVFSIAIGVLLLVSDGLSEVSILGASDQLAVESWVLGWARSISNWIVVAAAVLVLIAVFVVRRFAKRKSAVGLGR